VALGSSDEIRARDHRGSYYRRDKRDYKPMRKLNMAFADFGGDERQNGAGKSQREHNYKETKELDYEPSSRGHSSRRLRPRGRCHGETIITRQSMEPVNNPHAPREHWLPESGASVKSHPD
jgi:hypothetical protein